jgi:multiple sugar transport system permease protein
MVALPIALLFLCPLALMALGALRPVGAPARSLGDLVGGPWTLAGFSEAFSVVNLGRAFLNSVIVAGLFVPLSVLVASWGGFAIARMSEGWRAVLVVVSFVALMVPAFALIVGRFALFRSLGTIDTYVPLIAPALLGGSPLFVLLYLWAFRRVPGELFDAARLEGMGAFGQWWRVAMPLVRPVTVAVGILAFLLSWNDVLAPLVYLSDPRLWTLPVAMRSLNNLPSPYSPVMLAAALVATVPAVLALAVGQRSMFYTARMSGRLGR